MIEIQLDRGVLANPDMGRGINDLGLGRLHQRYRARCTGAGSNGVHVESFVKGLRKFKGLMGSGRAFHGTLL